MSDGKAKFFLIIDGGEKYTVSTNVEGDDLRIITAAMIDYISERGEEPQNCPRCKTPAKIDVLRSLQGVYKARSRCIKCCLTGSWESTETEATAIWNRIRIDDEPDKSMSKEEWLDHSMKRWDEIQKNARNTCIG